MAEVVIGYFLEDVAQERFLQALVERIAQDLGWPREALRHTPRNVTGGQGMATTALRQFLRDMRRGRERPFDVLVVVLDGNCQGYAEKRNEILAIAEQTGYPAPLVCAVPDPHIERWYLADPAALRQVLGMEANPALPSYKCERGRYKRALREAFAQADLIALLGGAEYGPALVEAIDFYAVGRADPAFRHFVEDLRAALAPLGAK